MMQTQVLTDYAQKHVIDNQHFYSRPADAIGGEASIIYAAQSKAMQSLIQQRTFTGMVRNPAGVYAKDRRGSIKHAARPINGMKKDLRNKNSRKIRAIETFLGASQPAPRPAPPLISKSHLVLPRLQLPDFGTPGWEELNDRRVELIHRLDNADVTNAEIAEYKLLQKHVDDAVSRRFPPSRVLTDSIALLESHIRSTAQ